MKCNGKGLKILYLLEILMIILFSLALFLLNNNKWIFCLIIFVFFLILNTFYKSHYKKNVFEKDAFFMMFIFSLLYLALYYVLGLYFGFYKNSLHFGFFALINYIFPIGLIIYFEESIRKILLFYKDKFSVFLTFIIMFIVDIYIYYGAYDLNNLEDFLTVFGFVVASSFINNLFFNYYSFRYSKNGLICFRLITVLYIYILPILPDVYAFFKSFLKMIATYFMFYYLDTSFSKKVITTKKYSYKANRVMTIIVILICTVLCLLVSCKFKYGIIVVATGSMHGTFDKGDVVFFEVYNKKQHISKGDIILFHSQDITMVHRVINIKNINGEFRYFTKGDANDVADEGYSCTSDIKGIYIFHIKYIGYPTLWLRDLFSS